MHGNPLAKDIWAEFGITTRRGLSFCNTLNASTVEIGLVGVAILFFGALFESLFWCSRAKAVGASFMIRQTMTMGVEVVLFFHLN